MNGSEVAAARDRTSNPVGCASRAALIATLRWDARYLLGFHVVCYGPTGQNQNANLKYDMKCLWANRTCDEYITAEDHLTPMTTEFIGAAEDHQITFGTRVACPTCPGN